MLGAHWGLVWMQRGLDNYKQKALAKSTSEGVLELTWKNVRVGLWKPSEFYYPGGDFRISPWRHRERCSSLPKPLSVTGVKCQLTSVCKEWAREAVCFTCSLAACCVGSSKWNTTFNKEQKVNSQKSLYLKLWVMPSIGLVPMEINIF